MEFGKHLHCSDARDRIFAILAISSGIDELGITPDYSQTVSEVFHNVSVALLQQETNLDFLNTVCKFDNLSSENCPSWSLNVPRPRQLKGNMLAVDRFAVHSRQNFVTRPRFDSNRSDLVLRGRIIDRIVASSGPTFLSGSVAIGALEPEYGDYCIQILDSLAQVLGEVGLERNNISSICLILLCSSIWKPTDGKIVHYFWCYIRHIVNLVQSVAQRLNVDFSEGISRAAQLIKSIATILRSDGIECSSVSDDLNKDEREMGSKMWQQINHHGRIMCVTEQRRISTVMNTVKEGDVIAAFEGSNRLWALSPLTSPSDTPSETRVVTRYQLIGDVSIDGLMRGEAYHGLDPDEVDCDIELV